jgi:hypothetical protein
MAKLAYQ